MKKNFKKIAEIINYTDEEKDNKAEDSKRSVTRVVLIPNVSDIHQSLPSDRDIEQILLSNRSHVEENKQGPGTKRITARTE